MAIQLNSVRLSRKEDGPGLCNCLIEHVEYKNTGRLIFYVESENHGILALSLSEREMVEFVLSKAQAISPLTEEDLVKPKAVQNKT
jgi:hypothetical protein